jgi:hypothetical protein
MSRPRTILIVLLVASTALFAVGAIAERSQADEHAEATSAQPQESNQPTAEPEGEHAAGDEAPGADQEGGGDEGKAGEAHAEKSETLLGINLESTPLIVLAVAVGLGLAAVAASQLGRLPAVLLAIALIALAWAALDVREVVHQLDESRAGVAILAIAVAVLHVSAAALAGWSSARDRHPATLTPDHPGTMAA